MLHRARILFLLGVMLATSAILRPELLYSQESNYKFYPHNYAESPLDGKSIGSEKLTPGADSKTPSDSQEQDKTHVTEIVPSLEASGKAIESISLIANNLDFTELQRSLEIMLKIYNEKAVKPSTLFLLGLSSQPYPKDLKNLIARLLMLGTAQSVSNEPPPNFKVTRVPSWIITLKEGDIVLEGANSPEKFINSKGQFIDPKDVVGGEIQVEAEPNNNS